MRVRAYVSVRVCVWCLSDSKRVSACVRHNTELIPRDLRGASLKRYKVPSLLLNQYPGHRFSQGRPANEEVLLVDRPPDVLPIMMSSQIQIAFHRPGPISFAFLMQLIRSGSIYRGIEQAEDRFLQCRLEPVVLRHHLIITRYSSPSSKLCGGLGGCALSL